MSYQALYRVWRPERFSDILGQEPIVTTLKNQIQLGRVAHAYLLCGSRGTGKTTTAKVLARAINCIQPLPGAEPCGVCDSCVQLMNDANMDVIEIDAASNNGVDEIRDLREKIKYPPSVGKYKVYIIDEVHMLSTGAFNALLKTLEEPPAHAVFILATTEPQRLPATILSRCQRFDFKRITASVIESRLREILRSQDVEVDADALSEIARAAEGGMRDALSLLDMCLSYSDGRLTAERVREALGTSDRKFLFGFADALIREDAAGALRRIDEMMRDGRDALVFAREMTSHLRALVIARYVKQDLSDLLEVAEEDALRYVQQAEAASIEKLTRAMDLFIRAESEMKWFSNPRSVLELCAVRVCHPERESSIETLLERVDRLEKRPVSIAPASSVPAPKQPEPKKIESAPAIKRAEPVLAAAREDEPDQKIWAQARKNIVEKQASMAALIDAVVFLRREADLVYLEMPKKWRMYHKVIDTPEKRGIVEQALSEIYGRPIRVNIALEGDTPAMRTPPEARRTLEQAYDVFGRENVIVMDD